MSFFYEDADWSIIPGYMQHGLRLYIENGIEPGGFLEAVLKNDLSGAYNRADNTNIHYISDYVRFLWTWAPSLCWGSEERYNAWLKAGGLSGHANKED